VDERFGEPTVRDIIAELDKPGRDPRPEFKTSSFKGGVEKIADLTVVMILEGVVTRMAWCTFQCWLTRQINPAERWLSSFSRMQSPCIKSWE
jgi:transcriptional accessory protein Tex/SPT6